MTVAILDGAEHQIPFPPLLDISSSTPVYASNGRYGGTSTTTYTIAGDQYQTWRVPAAVDDPEVWVGVAVLHNTPISSASNRPVLILWGDGVTTQHLTIYALTDGSLKLYRGDSSGTLLGTTATGIITVATWYYLELHAIIDDTTGEYEIRVDGVNVLSATGVDTRNGGTNPEVTCVTVGRASTDRSYYDDLYIITGDGTGVSGFQNEITIEQIKPNGAGNYTQLTPTGSATNWQNVDDIPFSTTDYNSSPTAGTKDTYAYSNLTATTGTILGSVIHFAANKNLAGFKKGRRLIRISSTDYAGADTPSLSATVRYFSEVLPESVATAAAWTISEVNGLEAGFEVRSA